jgi:hypothetical protein
MSLLIVLTTGSGGGGGVLGFGVAVAVEPEPEVLVGLGAGLVPPPELGDPLATELDEGSGLLDGASALAEGAGSEVWVGSLEATGASGSRPFTASGTTPLT